MLEGGLRLDENGLCEVIAADGVTLAVGNLSAHPGSQMIAGDDVVSAVQFSGKLTDAGRERVQS